MRKLWTGLLVVWNVNQENKSYKENYGILQNERGKKKRNHFSWNHIKRAHKSTEIRITYLEREKNEIHFKNPTLYSLKCVRNF